MPTSHSLPPIKVSPKPTPLNLAVRVPSNHPDNPSRPPGLLAPIGAQPPSAVPPVVAPPAPPRLAPPPTATNAVVHAVGPPAQAASGPDDKLFATLEEKLLICPATDNAGRALLLTELASIDQAKAWTLYQRIRATDFAAAVVQLPPPPPGLHSAPAVLQLRRATAWVERTLTSEDIPLLRSAFGASGPLDKLVGALHLDRIASLAHGIVSTAAATDIEPSLPKEALQPAAKRATQVAARRLSGRRCSCMGRRRKAASVEPAPQATSGAPAAVVLRSARIDWPVSIREVSAVCDALCTLSSGLSRASPSLPTDGASLPQLDRTSAIAAAAPQLAVATRSHIEQLFTGALTPEVAPPVRSSWAMLRTAEGGDARVLRSASVLVSSLTLHAGGALYGLVPALDVALCDAIATGACSYAKHATSLAEVVSAAPHKLVGVPAAAPSTASKTVSFAALHPTPPMAAAAPAPTGSTLDAAASTPADGRSTAHAGVADGETALAADAELLAVCLSSVLVVRSFVDRLASGDCRGASGRDVPSVQWRDPTCRARLDEASGVLTAAAQQLQSAVCEAAATLACAAAAAACSAEKGSFWLGTRPWRQDARCSLPMQLALTHVHASHTGLSALANSELTGLLHVRTLRRTTQQLLRLYWQRARPSAARHAVYVRDLRVLIALVLAEAVPTDLGAEPTAADIAAAKKAADTAAAADGPALATVGDGDLACERRRLAQLALWLLSLLALNAAPVSSLVEMLREGASDAADPNAPREAAEWAQIGVEAIALPSAVAATACAALALPDARVPAVRPLDGRGGGVDLPALEAGALARGHAKLEDVARAPMPDGIEWAALLHWDAFPLRAVPHLVRFVLRRRPDVEAGPPSAAGATAEDAAADGVKARVDSRELMALLNAVPSARRITCK